MSSRGSTDGQIMTSPSSLARRPLLRLAAALLVAVLAVAGWFAFNPSKHVPEASFTLLSGEKISTSQLKGKVYLINFWATSCTTCVAEMPAMVQTYDQFKGQGLEFIAVAMNYDAPMYVANYAKTRKLPFKVALDDGSAAERFGKVQLTPTTFVIGRDGKILKQYVGQPEFSELRQILTTALSQGQA